MSDKTKAYLVEAKLIEAVNKTIMKKQKHEKHVFDKADVTDTESDFEEETLEDPEEDQDDDVQLLGAADDSCDEDPVLLGGTDQEEYVFEDTEHDHEKDCDGKH